MEYTVSPTRFLGGSVKAPPSKSYTIRAVLCGLLADGVSTVRSPLVSRDTRAAFDACSSFGGSVAMGDGEVRVAGTGGRVKAPAADVDTLNSGTTIRICSAIASLAAGKVRLTGDASVRRRPIQPLLDALSHLGVKSSSAGGCPPLEVEGPLQGGSCTIPGDVSSQYVSALLMAAPYARKDVSVEVSTPMRSKPYVDLTLRMLGLFGVEAVNDGYARFTVEAGQKYLASDYTVEGDYSSAAFILAAAALSRSDVTVTNLFSDSLQADRKIMDILREMGAEVVDGGDRVKVRSGGALSGVTADLSDSPDLVPIVSVLGCLAEGRTEIVNAAHARLKECDRLKAMAAELRKMGASVSERQDGLSIVGGELKGAHVNGWEDHRVIMAMAVAGLKASGRTVISGAEHVDVTYPDFREAMCSLGARIKWG
jgi:3-phosphoshikimate 1-carboxyvinyltransferase